MEANWGACLKAILHQEGGNNDDPDDPGGRTSRGIIQREYDAYRVSRGLPKRDVWSATDLEVADIYHTHYWLPWCPKMQNGVDLVFFDISVNAGPVQATKFLQRALGVAADGHIGAITMAALSKADPAKVVKSISAQRRSFYHGLKGYWKYGKGWLRRTAEIEADAIRTLA